MAAHGLNAAEKSIKTSFFKTLRYYVGYPYIVG